MRRRSLPLLLAWGLPLGAWAHPLPAPDAEAIREAVRPGPGSGAYVSSRAYAHYLAARLAEERGDLQRALEEMRLASIFDDRSADLRVAVAWLYARTESLEKAVAELQRALRIDPDHAGAHLLLGKIRAAQHRRAEAAASLERAIERNPSDPEAWLVLTRLHADFGDWKAAEEVASRYEAAVPGDAAPWRLLARTAWEREEKAAAVRYLRRAVDRDREDAASRLHLALVEEREGNEERAAALYEEVLRLDPTVPQALLGAGRCALRRNAIAEARAYFTQLLGTTREPVASALQVAAAWREAWLPEEALATLDQALLADGEDPRLHFTRGLVLASLGRYGEAATAFARVTAAAGPLHAASRAYLADSLSLQGRHEQAIEAIQGALRLARPGGEEAEEVYRLVPAVYRRAGRSAAALALLEAEARRAESRLLAVAMGEVLADLGRFAQAEALLSSHLVRSPGDVRLLFALASVRERAEDYEGAVGLVQALLDGDPDNALALNFVGYVWTAQGVHLDEARALLLRAVQLEPDNPHILDSIGWCEVRRGNLRAGIAHLERALRMLPLEPVVLHHLAWAHRRLGDEAKASELWRRALEILERDPDPRTRREILRAQEEDVLPGPRRPGALVR